MPLEYIKFYLKIIGILLFSTIIIASIAVNLKIPKRHNIIFSALPKSGSSYMLESLANNIGLQRFRLTNTYYDSEKTAKFRMSLFFSHNHKIDKSHFRAPIVNNKSQGLGVLPIMQIDTFKKYNNKLVVHVRDPRQVLISLIHHIDKDILRSNFLPAEIKPYYKNWSLSEKIDWSIEYLYPSIIAWIDDWVTYKALQATDANPIDILFTTYEDMLENEELQHRKVAAFYHSPIKQAYIRPAKNEAVHFRKGDVQEFKTIYNKQQLLKVDTATPLYMYEYFGWQH